MDDAQRLSIKAGASAKRDGHHDILRAYNQKWVTNGNDKPFKKIINV